MMMVMTMIISTIKSFNQKWKCLVPAIIKYLDPIMIGYLNGIVGQPPPNRQVQQA